MLNAWICSYKQTKVAQAIYTILQCTGCYICKYTVPLLVSLSKILDPTCSQDLSCFAFVKCKMFAGGFERIWADDFVCMSVCVCILKHVCGCLGAWRCFGGKHKVRWPGLKTLLFQLTSPAACSSTGLIWRQRERDGWGWWWWHELGHSKTEWVGRHTKERLERVKGGEREWTENSLYNQPAFLQMPAYLSLFNSDLFAHTLSFAPSFSSDEGEQF